MELMEHMVNPEILPSLNCFLDPCRDPATVSKETSIIKPLDKFTKLRNVWNDLVVWSGFEKFA